jgi:hypothetical protein
MNVATLQEEGTFEDMAAELAEYRDREPALQRELRDLRAAQRRSASAFEIMNVVGASLAEASKFLVATEELELSCGTCLRVLSLIRTCTDMIDPNAED